MTDEEAGEFVSMVDGAWQPGLTEVQKTLWRNLCLPLDARAAFQVLVRLFDKEPFRPKPPGYISSYKRELIDRTPVYVGHDRDRDEMPAWVPGWRLSRSEGDHRAWPEEEKGCRQLHAFWLETVGAKFAKEHDLKSGHEWEDFVHERGLMPADARLDYMTRAKERGPQTGEEMAAAIGGGVGQS